MILLRSVGRPYNRQAVFRLWLDQLSSWWSVWSFLLLTPFIDREQHERSTMDGKSKGGVGVVTQWLLSDMTVDHHNARLMLQFSCRSSDDEGREWFFRTHWSVVLGDQSKRLGHALRTLRHPRITSRRASERWANCYLSPVYPIRLLRPIITMTPKVSWSRCRHDCACSPSLLEVKGSASRRHDYLKYY